MEAGHRDRPQSERPGDELPGLPAAGFPDLPELPEPPGAAGLPELPTVPDALTADGPDSTGHDPEQAAQGSSFRELRPPRRLRVWQLIPIVGLGTVGSLMFAFPLAFEFGDGGPVVAMLGLLLSCCSAGWAIMAARRVGYTWPGLPARGSGDRPDWRFVAGYTAFAVLVALLAVWRVARLR
ncbi:hypothetical protein [Streptantibioticus cattleyicolor]|nr:hypothetical protein [Streptomyces sp. SID5468]